MPKKGIKIVSTTAQIGDLAARLVGERGEVDVLIDGELDPHSYDLVKGDGERLEEADLIFYHGLGLEHGASLSSLLRASPQAVAIGEKIAERAPGEILKRGEVVDPHLWMDASLWQKGVAPMVEALSQADPEGASGYRERGEALEQKLSQLDRALQARFSEIPPEKRYLVTSHDAFHYFVRRYLREGEELDWQKRFAAPEGLAPDGQLNPLNLQHILSFVRQNNVSVLFPESNVSKDSIRKIALAGRELGVSLRLCPKPLYGDAMGSLSYFEMMEHNLDVIAKELEHGE